MIKALILVGVGLGVAYVISRLRAQKAKDDTRRNIQQSVQVTNDITQVGKGGVLKLPPFGPQRTAIETFVKTRHRYADGGQPWYELVCEAGSRTLLIEWERDGAAIDLSAGYEDGNPRLKELGLSEAILAEIDDEEEGDFEWDGTTWHYEDSGEITCYEHDGGRGEQYYNWDFESDDGQRFLSIEKWGNKRTFEVFVSWKIDPDQIEIFSSGKD